MATYLSVDPCNQILLKYYTNPMSSDTVLSVGTDMSEVMMDVIKLVFDDLAQKLFNSGYKLE